MRRFMLATRLSQAIVSLVFFVGAALVSVSEAATCSYTNFTIGTEFTAQYGPNNRDEYGFSMVALYCNASGQIVQSPVGGGVTEVGVSKPQDLVDTLRRTFGSSFAESRVFVDRCRLNLILVNRRYPASQSVNGKPMADYPDTSGRTVYENVFPAPLLLPLGAAVSLPTDCGCSGGLAKPPGSAICTPPPPVKAPEPGLCIANPILPGQGCKVQRETDYSFGGASPWTFQRYYHSQSPYHAQSAAQRSMGNRWRHNHDVLLNPAAGANLVLVLRGDGQILHFHPNVHCESWVAPPRMMKDNSSGWKRERSSNDMAVTPRSPT